MRLVGVGLLIVGSLSVWRMARERARYRAGPWPGLSPAGAVVLLGCALLLGGAQLVLGEPRMALPDLPLLAVLALGPMALATRLVRAPGVASAVCGAYLLPSSLLSLVDPSIEPPPLLLVPALAFDLIAWQRASDLANLRHLLPGRQSVWRRHTVGPRRCGRRRAAVAGAVFGLVLAAIEPPFAVLLGADPAAWSGTNLWLASGLTALGCGVVGLAAASGQRTEA